MIKIQINLLAFFFHQNFDLNFCGNCYRATDLEKTDFFFDGKVLLPGVLQAVLWVHQWRLHRVPLTVGGSDARHLRAQCMWEDDLQSKWRNWFGFWLELSQLHFKQANYSFNMQIQEMTYLPCFIIKAILDNMLVSSFWWCFRWFLSVF